MAVAAAETEMITPAETLAYAVPETAEDILTRARAAEFISKVAVSHCVEAPTNVDPIESLYEGIKRGANRDPEAIKMVKTNARTDVIERTIKAGHVMSVDLMVDENGKIRQHGQSMDSVQANSLRFAASSKQMRERTEAETRNAFRIEEKYHAGELESNSFVVISRAADNMSDSAMEEAGFFTETMSCAIQVTSVKNGRLVTESAFVAGVAGPNEDRHDKQTVTEMFERLGVDVHDKSAAEIIDTPIMVDNSLIPNGAIDLVEMYDDCAGGMFFGENKDQQNYQDYLRVCRERELRFKPKVDEIVQRLLAEADTITDPVMATHRLHKISEEEMLAQAIGDEDIKPEVFGQEAARHIIEARAAYQAGNVEGLQYYWQRALATADSSSCPGAPGTSGESMRNESDSESSVDCEFVSKECPLCHAKNVKTRVTKTHIYGSCGCSKSK
jgi:hypothetical protein